MGTDEKKKQNKKMKRESEEGNKNGGEGGPRLIDDERFAAAQSDPRFMDVARKRSKVEIDSRFSNVFSDPRFTSSTAPVDKRGKRIKGNQVGGSLKHYYRLEKEEYNKRLPVVENEGGTEGESDKIGIANRSGIEKLDGSSEDDEDDGQSSDGSSASSSTDYDDMYADSEEEDALMEPDENIARTDKETRRLAVVNLDWSQVRAVDLYAVLSSFLPKGGQVMSVAIYPTEFGIKRMEEEAVRGPVGLFDGEEEDDDGQDDEIDMKKLRAYELSRLRYYCAVVECDSIATADYLYRTCDGHELGRSANKLDLRFIPDSWDFKHQPRDIASEVPENYEGLDFQTRALQHSKIDLTWDEDEPQRIKTLNRKLNDEQLARLELKEFLASDESESDEDEDDGHDGNDESRKKDKKLNKYRALIQSGESDEENEDNDENKDQDLEITFNSGLEDISKRILEKKDKKSETVWEAHLRKRKEKRKASKNQSKYSSEDDSTDSEGDVAEQPDDFFIEEPSIMGTRGDSVKTTKKNNSGREVKQDAEASIAELELLVTDDTVTDTHLKGYNLKPKKIKGKKGKIGTKETNVNNVLDEAKLPSVNYDDPRFSSLFTSPLFALDPTDPQFKRSATYARQVTHKLKKGDEKKVGERGVTENPTWTSSLKGESAEIHGEKTSFGSSGRLLPEKQNDELSSLVGSIKMKLKQASLPSKDKVIRRRKPLI